MQRSRSVGLTETCRIAAGLHLLGVYALRQDADTVERFAFLLNECGSLVDFWIVQERNPRGAMIMLRSFNTMHGFLVKEPSSPTCTTNPPATAHTFLRAA